MHKTDWNSRGTMKSYSVGDKVNRAGWVRFSPRHLPAGNTNAYFSVYQKLWPAVNTFYPPASS